MSSPEESDESRGVSAQDARDARAARRDGSNAARDAAAGAARGPSGEGIAASIGAAETDAEDRIDIRVFAQTDVGLVREHNEDNFLVTDFATGLRGVDALGDKESHATAVVSPRGTILAVCDGMGGAAAGEVASQLAVDTLFEFFQRLGLPQDRDHFARRIVASVEDAGARIFLAAKADRARRGMGTTATVAGLIDKVLFVGQVGDSRAYVLRQGKLVQITKDQSLVNQLIEAGQLTEDEAEAFEHSNIILQALGTTEEVTVDLTFLELRDGDRLMMCSDGLSGLVHQDMIQETLESAEPLRAICARLIDMAKTGGGHDNITVLCADFSGPGLAPPQEDEPVTYQQYPLPAASDEEKREAPSRFPRASTSAGRPASDPARAQGPSLRPGPPKTPAGSQTSPWAIIFLAGALAFSVVLLLWWSNGDDARRGALENEDDSLGSLPPPNGEALDPVTTKILSGPVLVNVTVTGVHGQLWVDGQSVPVPEGHEAVQLELEPGVHRFESRTADGDVVEDIRPIVLGDPAEIQLNAHQHDQPGGDAPESRRREKGTSEGLDDGNEAHLRRPAVARDPRPASPPSDREVTRPAAAGSLVPSPARTPPVSMSDSDGPPPDRPDAPPHRSTDLPDNPFD